MQQPNNGPSVRTGKPDRRTVSDGGRAILDALLKSGGMSQAALTRSLDLAQPTVTRLLQGFAKDGLVATSARPSDRPGHPSVHVTLNPDFAYAVGVAITGDALAMTLMDLAGQVRGRRKTSMLSMTQELVCPQLAKLKRSILKEAAVEPRRLIGAGVAVSGYFVEGGQWVNPLDSLEEWALRDIRAPLEEALDLPVEIENDGTAAAIGESLFGVGRRYSDFAYLHLTNGFGGGLISGGQPIRGANGNAGEFGGVWGLLSDVYPNLELLRSCLGKAGHSFATVSEMVDTIDVSWPGASTWVDLATPPFRLLCTILARCFDPTAIVIGGELPRSLAAALASKIIIPAASDRRGRPPALPTVLAGEIEGAPSAIGAASMRLKAAFFT